MANQIAMLQDAEFPTVNFIGNKEKMAPWILDRLACGGTFADVFSGGSSVGFEAKRRGYSVISNDIMKINYMIAKALIENSGVVLDEDDVQKIFATPMRKGFMYRHYSNRAFFPEECMMLDGYRRGIERLSGQYKRALAIVLMRRAMIRKMPYSRFTIPWHKVVQLRNEEYSYRKYGRRRAYHNMSFKEHFMDNLDEYNRSIFDNGKENRAYNMDVFGFLRKLSGDIAYLDPPYMGTMSDYRGFYGTIDDYVLKRRTVPSGSDFTHRASISKLLDGLFSHLGNFRYWALSYNNNSYPPKREILCMIRRHSKSVTVYRRRHVYKVSGTAMKSRNVEYLFVAKNAGG